eukprot:jgi/Galph1/5611/GphlegSOOS_G4262.1
MASSYKRFMNIQQKKQNTELPSRTSRRHSNPENRSSSTRTSSRGNTPDKNGSTLIERYSSSSCKESQENDQLRANILNSEAKKDSISRNSSYSGGKSYCVKENTGTPRSSEERQKVSSGNLDHKYSTQPSCMTNQPLISTASNICCSERGTNAMNACRDTSSMKTAHMENQHIQTNDSQQPPEVEQKIQETLADNSSASQQLQALASQYKSNIAVSPRPRTKSFIDSSTEISSISAIIEPNWSFNTETKFGEDSRVLSLKGISRQFTSSSDDNVQKSSYTRQNTKSLSILAKRYLQKDHFTTSGELFRIASASTEADDEERISFVQWGYTQKLVEIFDRDQKREASNIVEKVHVASIVGNLALADNNEQALAESGLLERFILVVKNLAPYTATEKSLRSPMHIKCCVGTETIPYLLLLVSRMALQSSSCVTESTAALRNLCKSEDCRTQIVKSGGVKIFCKLLAEINETKSESFNPELLSQVCSFLAEIVIDCIAAMELVSIEETIPILLRNISSAIPEIAFESIRAIANCFASEEAQNLFLRCSYVEQTFGSLERVIKAVFQVNNTKNEIEQSLSIAIAIEASRALANLALGSICEDSSKSLFLAKICLDVILNDDEENLPALVVDELFELRGECLRCISNLSEENSFCICFAQFLATHPRNGLLNVFLRKCIQYCGDSFREDVARLVSNLLEHPYLKNESSVLNRLYNVLSENESDRFIIPDEDTSNLLIPFLSSFSIENPRKKSGDIDIENLKGLSQRSNLVTPEVPLEKAYSQQLRETIADPLESFIEELHLCRNFAR